MVLMKKTIAKETALAEITLRRYEKPTKVSEREIVRKLCLSLGLLQPGDSRDVIVDILAIMVKARHDKKLLSSEDIEKEVIEHRKKHKLVMRGIASSNIRRQIRRLRDIYLVEKIKSQYRLTEFESIRTIFEQKIERYYLQSILERVKEYAEMVK